MSSVFSRKMTMLTDAGFFTGDGTPASGRVSAAHAPPRTRRTGEPAHGAQAHVQVQLLQGACEGWRSGCAARRALTWRSATFRLRMPPPTGVVSGPLMPTSCLRKVSWQRKGEAVSRSASAIRACGAHQRLSRQPLAGLVERLLAGQHLQPLDLARAAVRLVHRRVEHVLGGAPDVRAGAVALRARASERCRRSCAHAAARGSQRGGAQCARTR
jgi:hypothetical protein